MALEGSGERREKLWTGSGGVYRLPYAVDLASRGRLGQAQNIVDIDVLWRCPQCSLLTLLGGRL